MITDEMKKALNLQVNAEMESAYLYLAISFKANEMGLRGVSHWFRMQYEEELEHAFRITAYLEKQMAKVELKNIAVTTQMWTDVRSMFESSLKHEKTVTEMIRRLCDRAADLKDYATHVFLQWFVTEQVEEEDSVQCILDRLSLIGDDKVTLLLLDEELGRR